MNKSSSDEGKVTVIDSQRGKYQRGGCITVSVTHLLNPFLFLSIAHTLERPDIHVYLESALTLATTTARCSYNLQIRAARAR